MHICVVGTHEYQWALWPFGGLFAKYWGPGTVTYCGDHLAGDLPDNLEFVQVPAYGMGTWPWEHWFGNGLRSYLEIVDDPIVALFLPDHWICDSVDAGLVLALHDYMLAHDDVVRGNLTAGTALEDYGQVVDTWDNVEIISVPPSDPHAGLDGGTTFCPSLWNRERLIKLLEPDWDLWQCELFGTRKMVEHGGLRSVGTRPAALHRVHGLSHRQPRVVFLDGLRGEDWALVRRHLPEGWRLEG